MLELQVARGAMQHIKDASPEKILVNLGVSEENLKLVRGAIPWTGQQRMEVVRTLDALNHGVCDIVGIPRISLPAEFVSASIANFVHPCNTRYACSWMEVKEGVKEMAGGNLKSIMQEEITSNQLFAQVLMLQGGDQYSSSTFKNEVQKAVDQYMQSENSGGSI